VTERLIVALDGTTKEEALQLARKLSGLVWGFKVNDLLLGDGVQIVRDLKQVGNVFADPKLHDIPNTVSNGVVKLREAGADFITVHASGGEQMLKAAVSASNETKILAITALTSLSEKDTKAIYQQATKDAALSLALLAKNANVDGLVCSANELKYFGKGSEFENLLKVVPGIRPSWYSSSDDQVRTSTPQSALQNGANYLVIGRPITASKDPVEAVKQILSEI